MIKYVKIIHNTEPHVWYYNKVGQVFEVDGYAVSHTKTYKVSDYKHPSYGDVYLPVCVVEEISKAEYLLIRGIKTVNIEPMNDDFEKQLAMQEQALILAGKVKNIEPIKMSKSSASKEEELEFYKNSLKKVTKDTDYEVYTSVNAERSSTLNQIKSRSRKVNYNSTTLVMR